MNLEQLQDTFLSEICGEDKGLSDYLIEQGKLSSQQRIHIYQHAYLARLYGVLETDFPSLGLLLGDELFDNLIESYIRSHPSHTPSINYYGRHLPKYIQQYPPLSQQTIALELCAFEWQLRESFDAKNSKIIDQKFLETVPNTSWPELRFKCVPSLAIHYFSMNTVEVWQAIKDKQTPSLKQEEHPQGWVIWRQGLITQFRSMDVDEACTLALIAQGDNFESMCEALLEWHSEESVPARAFQLMHNWIRAEMLAPM